MIIYCGKDRIRTRMALLRRWSLSPSCIPISSLSHCPVTRACGERGSRTPTPFLATYCFQGSYRQSNSVHLSLPSLFYPRFPVTHVLMTSLQLYYNSLLIKYYMQGIIVIFLERKCICRRSTCYCTIGCPHQRVVCVNFLIGYDNFFKIIYIQSNDC